MLGRWYRRLMLYGILTVVSVLLLFLVFITLDSYRRYTATDEKKTSEKENYEYHEQKHNKIKEQYYRGIQIESKSTSIDNQYDIVGMATPKGKWTAMVIKQNMQYISTLKNLMGNNFSKLGLWQLKVKAQSLISNAMQKGKGR